MGVGAFGPCAPRAEAATANAKAETAASAVSCMALFIRKPPARRARPSGHQAPLAQGARQLVVGRRAEYLPGHVHGRLPLLAAILFPNPLAGALVPLDVDVLVADAEPFQQLARVPRVLAPVRAVDPDPEHRHSPSSPRLGNIITRARAPGNSEAEARPSGRAS